MQEPAPYWEKGIDYTKLSTDLAWNFPEQHKGVIKILGGNSSSFSVEVKAAEYINRTFPFVKSIKNIFPDVLKSKFPPLDNLEFYKSTDSGSFADSVELSHAFEDIDCGIIMGDLSKNSVTSIAVSKLVQNNPSTPLVLTRDAVDLVSNSAGDFINRDQLYIIASMASFQKLLRALYYPRPLMLSQPIFPVVETFHKFTLSYPVSILTFHDGKIICANNGKVSTIEIEKTDYTPLSLWSGELAANIAVYAMFNPSTPLESMLAAINHKC
ncbi:hypothetical protein IK146_02130 [Candidatus Saccharibacteria bacterium]|nr:hypothetical protein [Candidatus Saccharibacteria bacterium]